MEKGLNHTRSVDEIEEGSASIEVEGRSRTPFPKGLLPVGVGKRDRLAVTHEREEGKSVLALRVGAQAREKAMDRSAKQVSRRSGKDRGGDIQL